MLRQHSVHSTTTTSYPLTDTLGSVRGVTDSSGTLTGSTSYDAFGAVRSRTGSSLALGYTGQLTDPSTGLIDLRARQLDPTLGRFLSADTVQPNAPGTQGYNLYAYTANNPTTWTDLSGNSVGDAALGVAVLLGRACLFFSWCRGPLADGVRRIAVGSNAGDWRSSPVASRSRCLPLWLVRWMAPAGILPL